MKLKAETAGETHDVEIMRGDHGVTARVGDRSYDLDVSEPEPGVFLIKHGSLVYEAVVSETAGGKSSLRVGNAEFEITITDPKRLRGSGTSGQHDTGKAEIKTAMPGKVVRILKQTGETVTKGEGVIVVEAMKMQNEMKSPKVGRISEIKVAEGDTVGAGDVLVVID